MRTNKNRSVTAVINSITPKQLEKLKAAYQLTETELKFLFSLTLKYQRPRNFY